MLEVQEIKQTMDNSRQCPLSMGQSVLSCGAQSGTYITKDIKHPLSRLPGVYFYLYVCILLTDANKFKVPPMTM